MEEKYCNISRVDKTLRPYQQAAKESIFSAWDNNDNVLFQMPTGTGKTRLFTSIISDIKAWSVLNSINCKILIIAHRVELIDQISESLGKYKIPHGIIAGGRTRDLRQYVQVASIQTITHPANVDAIAELNVGFIIIDEAHRSVFGKYTAIFDYFDCLLVGLTATPRDEVECNTFDLFNIEAEDTFAYELEEAVEDGYLVPYNALKRGTEILKRGIVYNSLSAEEKAQLDIVWKYEKARKALDDREDYHRNIESKEIFKYIFNIDTIDKVLQDLMQCGQKVQSGERIGKTIIDISLCQIRKTFV